VDLNGDGKPDIVAGDVQGNVWFFENIGTKTDAKLAKGVKLKADGKDITRYVGDTKVMATAAELKAESEAKAASDAKAIEAAKSGQAAKGSADCPVEKVAPGEATEADAKVCWATRPFAGDYDNDGLIDILLAQSGGRKGEEIIFFKNIGSKTKPEFAKARGLAFLKTPEMREMVKAGPTPILTDWDVDGKVDMLCGTHNKAYFLRNTGTNEKPAYDAPEEIDVLDMEGGGYRLCAVDWNEDGKLDLLIGNRYSGGGEDKKEHGGNVWLFLRK
jgi:hypothetical protein